MLTKRYNSHSLVEKTGDEFVKTFDKILKGNAVYVTQKKQILEFNNGQVESKRQIQGV